MVPVDVADSGDELRPGGVWAGAQPGDDVEAGAVYEQLFEEYMEGEEFDPTPRIVAYAEELAERWAAVSGGRSSG